MPWSRFKFQHICKAAQPLPILLQDAWIRRGRPPP